MKKLITNIIYSIFESAVIIKYIEKFTRAKVIKNIPFGINPISDIHFSIQQYNFNIVFDVGANVGQSENTYAKQLPHSNIYCFEPINDSFSTLKNNIIGKHTHCHNIAFGEKEESVEIKINKKKTSDVISLNNNEQKAHSVNDYLTYKIDVDTLDNFTTKHNIEYINFLKVDTEGYDLKVVKGAKNLLLNQKIDFIEVEVSMNKFNDFHVSFVEMYQHLERMDYHIFGVYEQFQEFGRKPFLRRSNMVFISKNKIDNNGLQ